MTWTLNPAVWPSWQVALVALGACLVILWALTKLYIWSDD